MSEWYYSGKRRRDFRHSDHPEDWLPAKYRSKIKRIKGKRVCGKDKTRPCEFTIKKRIWSYTTPESVTNYYVNACPKCGRHGQLHEREYIERTT